MQIVFGKGNVQGAQRGRNGLGLIGQCLGEFKGHHLADALDVIAEEQAVLLVALVAQLRHILVDDGVLLAKIDDVHKIIS